jgi:hypothetical protein
LNVIAIPYSNEDGTGRRYLVKPLAIGILVDTEELPPKKPKHMLNQ